MLPQNYRPFCMLSCARKVIETVNAEQIARILPIFGRQFGFQRGFSPPITLMELDSIVKEGNNRIATLDLKKAYDKVKSAPAKLQGGPVRRHSSHRSSMYTGSEGND